MSPAGSIVEVDLLIVGAGPAGAAAALRAARGGLRALVVERHPQIGAPVRCGEYVPLALGREVPAGTLSVAQKVPALVLHLPSGGERRIAAPGAVIDRGRFDRALAGAAVEAGAELRCSTRFEKLGRDGICVLGGRATSSRVKAKLIIGCDGPRSKVARSAGLGGPRVMLGLQRVVALRSPLEEAHLYFWQGCRHGYGWLFPKGISANLGVAVPRGYAREGREALATLIEKLEWRGVIEAQRGETDEDDARGGLVPCGGPLPRLGTGRVLLAGDAAGQTDPLTGAGIVAAVRGGTMAAETACEALEDSAWRRAAPGYEERWRSTFGKAAARSLWRRQELEARWERDVEAAVELAWVGEVG